MVWNDTRLDSALEQLTRPGLRFGTMALDGERVELLYAVTRNLAPFDDVDEPLLILRLERDELVTIQLLTPTTFEPSESRQPEDSVVGGCCLSVRAGLPA